MKYDTDWLQSDGTIIGRAQKSPHKEGTMWVVVMPDGEHFGAVLQQQNATAVAGFCELVRGEWNERKEEQEAKARSKEEHREPVDGPVALPQAQETGSFITGLVEQLTRAEELRDRHAKRLAELMTECRALEAALGTLSHDVKTLVELELSPDAESDSTEDDSFHKETNIYSGTDEGTNSNSDASEDLGVSKRLQNTT